MFKSLILLICLVSSSLVLANPYAPNLKNLVVLYDRSEDYFSPYVFQTIQGEYLELSMHSSCKKVSIDFQQVYCHSTSGLTTIVGEITGKRGQHGFWTALSVNWYANVEIFEQRTPRGLSYSLRVN